MNQNAPFQQPSGVLLEPSADDQPTSAPSTATEQPTNDDLMEMLYSRLERRGLRAVETEGDGNCFFRAVSRMVYGTDKYYSTVRDRAVEWMEENENDVRDFLVGSLPSAPGQTTPRQATPGEYIDRLETRLIPMDLQKSKWAKFDTA